MMVRVGFDCDGFKPGQHNDYYGDLPSCLGDPRHHCRCDLATLPGTRRMIAEDDASVRSSGC
jgi:hypothetical protein